MSNHIQITRWMQPWSEEALLAAEDALNGVNNGPIQEKDIVVYTHDHILASVVNVKDDVVYVLTRLLVDDTWIWGEMRWQKSHVRKIAWGWQGAPVKL